MLYRKCMVVYNIEGDRDPALSLGSSWLVRQFLFTIFSNCCCSPCVLNAQQRNTHTHTHTHKHTHTHIHNPHRTHWARTVSLKLSGRSLALRRCEFAKLLRLASLSARLASLSASHSVSGSESESARLAGLRAIVG